MKILLTTLNSQYVHSNLAIRYMYTVIANEDCETELREFSINNDLNYIYNEIVRADYDLVCFSCYLWNIEETTILASDIKKAKPEMKILIGGPETSFDGVEYMEKNDWCDYVISGEGEYSFFRLIQILTGNRQALDMTEMDELSTVPGLAYREGPLIYVNEQIEPLDFNSIPFPYSVLEPEKDKVVYYESSRGCPFRCSYCMSSIEKTVRALDVVRVEQELKYFLFKNLPQVKFIDRTFNYEKDRAYQILNYIIQNDNGVTNFHFELCGDLLDNRTLELLSGARKGLFQMEIGIQSTNPETLKAVHRAENVYPVLYNTGRLVECGTCHTHVDLIAGLPYETMDTFERGFDKVYSLKADAFQMGFLKVLKGTEIHDRAEEFGIVYRDHTPYEVVSTTWINADEMVHLKEIDRMLDTYYNRKGFTHTLDYLTSEMTPFKLFSALADFYYQKGYQNRDRRKDDQYRIMLEFAKKLDTDGTLKGCADEVLKTLDLDARESMDRINYGRFIRKGWELTV